MQGFVNLEITRAILTDEVTLPFISLFLGLSSIESLFYSTLSVIALQCHLISFNLEMLLIRPHDLPHMLYYFLS